MGSLWPECPDLGISGGSRHSSKVSLLPAAGDANDLAGNPKGQLTAGRR